MNRTISLDQQLINYETSMNQLADRYSYKAPDVVGIIPKKIYFKEEEFTLLTHRHNSELCDNPRCKEIFDYQNNLRKGLTETFYPYIPLYMDKHTNYHCGVCLGL